MFLLIGGIKNNETILIRGYINNSFEDFCPIFFLCRMMFDSETIFLKNV
jgi:hypothetical protein